MHPKFSMMEILRRAVAGADQGAKNHIKWTQGKGIPWHSSEYVLTVHAMAAIWRAKLRLLMLCEANAREAAYQSSALKGRYPKALSMNSRADVVVYNEKLSPRGVIEVKRGVWDSGQIAKDAKRLSYILRRNGTIRFGILLFTTGCLAERSGGRPRTMLDRAIF